MNRSVRKRTLFPAGKRSAFTLVELLVVIVIIGILIALLVPTIGMAMTAAKTARMSTEVGNLAQAIEKYKMDKGAYPPDFALDSATDEQLLDNHLARNFRNRNVVQERGMLAISSHTLDPAEALVFWLSGFAKDPKFPLARREQINGVPLKGASPYFDFDPGRLQDKDQDGYPEFYPQGSEAPYVYIRHDHYGTETTPGSGQFSSTLVSALNGGIGVRAYVAEAVSANNVQRFAAHDKYQIICAGLDGEFGAGASGIAVFPDGAGYVDADNDNITNFSDGKNLEDSIP